MRRHPLALCEECPLNQPDASFTPSQGPEQADLVIIGEAPGFQEARKGVPFTGQSGKLLDTVLQHHGVDRSKAFVTNTVLCRHQTNRQPTPQEIRACLPRLQAEVASRRPKTILALGNSAAQTVLQTRDGVTKLRVGQGRESEFFPGVRVIPTVHPAACLRQHGMFPNLITDVGKLKVNTGVKWIEPIITVITDPDKGRRALDELAKKERLTVDIETGVEKDEVFTHAELILCTGICYAPGKVVVFGTETMSSPTFRKQLDDLLDWHPHLSAQNGKFDFQTLGHGKLFFDTMLASYCRDERGTGIHGLEYQAVEVLGAPSWKTQFAKDKGGATNYANIPRDILYQYNGKDCNATWLLEDVYTPLLKAEGLRPLHDHLVRVSNVLMAVEYEGVKVDLEYNLQLQAEYDQLLGGLEKDLRQWVWNPRSWQQIKAAFLQEGIEVENTQADEIQKVVELTENMDSRQGAHKLAVQLLEYKKHFKQESTYVRGIRNRVYNGRIYSTFLIHGTGPGRLSSRNPNLQNITRGDRIRRQFIPEEGNVFIQGDYKTIELRVLAVESQDEYLFSVLKDPSRDIHDETALEFYGSGWTKENRIRAKAIVYGLPYGRSAYSIADEYRMSQPEADAFYAAFFSKIPQAVAYQQSIKKRILAGEDLITHFGRHHRVWLITDQNVKDVIKEGYAFTPQSTANDICLSSLTPLRAALPPPVRIRIPVHDSILTEAPKHLAEEAAAIQKEVMERTAWEGYSKEMPFPVDIKIGSNWSEV